MDQIRIVAFAGSLRRASFNRGLIRAAVEEAPEGIRMEVLDLAGLPLFNQDIEDAGEPPAVVRFKRAIADADAMLIATPEYNHGMSGVLKNAIDWASRPPATSPLHDKAVAVMGASPGRGATARAQAQLRDACVFTGACVMPLPELLIGSAAEHFDREGNLVDPKVRTAVRDLVVALHAWTLRIAIRDEAA